MARILVVDDSAFMRVMIKKALDSGGYEIVGEADNADDAVKLAVQLRPDLVLMDILLKGDSDGIAAAERIRALCHLPIIYLTAYDPDSAMIRRAKITDAYGYILKPFENKALVTTIEIALYKHKMEQRLLENEQWLVTTLQSIGDAIIATDPTERIVLMNPVAEALTGWKLAEARGMLLTDVFRVIDETISTPAGTSGGGHSGTATLVGRTGKTIAIESVTTVIRAAGNHITGVVLVFRDITERKRIEEALQFTQYTVDHAAEAVFWVSREGRLDYANDAMCRMVGYTRSELAGVTVFDLTAALTKEAWATQWEWLTIGQTVTKEAVYRTRQGRTFPAELVLYYVEHGGAAYTCAFVRDITERKLAELALKDSNNYLAGIVNDSPEAILTTNAEGLIVAFNRSAARLLKYTPAEVAGKHLSLLLPPGENLALEDARVDGREFRARDGSSVRLNLSSSRLYQDGVLCGLVVMLKEISAIDGVHISPTTEAWAGSGKVSDLDVGRIYLLDKGKHEDCIEIFAGQVKHNLQGLCVTRQNPKRVRERYGLEKTPIIWLNAGEGIEGETLIKPDNMSGLGATIFKFLHEAKDGLILLDGMEYLMTRNSYESLLKFIHYLNDRVMQSNSRILFCIDSASISENQYRILMSEMVDLSKASATGRN